MSPTRVAITSPFVTGTLPGEITVVRESPSIGAGSVSAIVRKAGASVNRWP